MRVTDRDRKLLANIALHQVMTREQIVKLGYFTSVQRANARLLELRKVGLLRTVRLNPSLETRQFLYAVAGPARDFLDSRVVALLSARSFTPRHVDHALAVVDVRIALQTLGMDRWLPEPQVRHRYQIREGSIRRTEDFRPDGLAMIDGKLVFVEVDRGHVSMPRMKLKLETYRGYVRHGVFKAIYGQEKAFLLIVTSAKIRKRRIGHQINSASPVVVAVETFDSISRATSLSEIPLQ